MSYYVCNSSEHMCQDLKHTKFTNKTEARKYAREWFNELKKQEPKTNIIIDIWQKDDDEDKCIDFFSNCKCCE